MVTSAPHGFLVLESALAMNLDFFEVVTKEFIRNVMKMASYEKIKIALVELSEKSYEMSVRQ